MRRIAGYVGKKYGVEYRYVIKDHKDKTIKYPEDINNTTATRTGQLICKGEKLKMWIKKRKMMRKLKRFTESYGDNALAQ